MDDIDMNDSEQTQGIPLSKLLEIIGKQTVEWIVEQEAVAKLKENYFALTKEFSAVKTELEQLKTASTSNPELDALKKANSADDERIQLLEKQVHDVALERDAIRKAHDEAQKNIAIMGTTIDDERNRYFSLQETCNNLQKEVDALKEKKGGKKV